MSKYVFVLSTKTTQSKNKKIAFQNKIAFFFENKMTLFCYAILFSRVQDTTHNKD